MTNALEAHIRKVARALHDHQLARLYKVPNDIRLVDGEVVHGDQQPADFLGFTITGRVIVLEAKMRKSKALELGPRGIKAHQRIAITEAHRAGGLGLVAWMNGRRIAVIDASQVKVYSEGRKSIPWSAIPDRFMHTLEEEPTRFLWPFLRTRSGS